MVLEYGRSAQRDWFTVSANTIFSKLIDRVKLEFGMCVRP